MPSALTYPGVYIEEVPSGVRTITGVSTSVAAFIGFFKRGATQSAIQVFNFSDFTREFGGLEASYAVQQFFLNGGTEAWVVRTAAAGSAIAAAISLKESATAAKPLRNNLQSLASFFRGLPRVLGCVTLKGAAIWSSADGTTLYLDGRAFGEPARATNAAVGTALIFPSGNNERARDFESWFLLTLPTVVGGFAIVPPYVRLMQRANAFVFTAAEVARDPIEVVGTITLSAVATTDVVSALSVTENRELIEIPASVTVPAGSTSSCIISPPALTITAVDRLALSGGRDPVPVRLLHGGVRSEPCSEGRFHPPARECETECSDR